MQIFSRSNHTQMACLKISGTELSIQILSTWHKETYESVVYSGPDGMIREFHIYRMNTRGPFFKMD